MDQTIPNQKFLVSGPQGDASDVPILSHHHIPMPSWRGPAGVAGARGKVGRHLQLLKNDTLGVGGTLEGGGLEDGAEAALAVGLVGPARHAVVSAQLARSVESTGLALSYAA